MSDSAAIYAEGLGKTYYMGVRRQKLIAVQNINFEVRAGEVFAFLGLNGAGKTTTIKMLLDHARPTSGRCLLFGMDSRLPSARVRVGYMPDLPHFHRFLTAGELIDYFGRLQGLSKPECRKSADRLLELVGLAGRGNEPLKGYSRGMLQRVGLAQALLGDPDLLILDEPLGGLDPIGRHEFHSIIMKLKADGKTIFFSSHILDDAERVADRVGIIHHGALLAMGRLDELLSGPPGWEVEIELTGFDQILMERFKEARWNPTNENGRMRLSIPDREGIQVLTRIMSDNAGTIISINPRRLRLEEAFLAELQKWRP